MKAAEEEPEILPEVPTFTVSFESNGGSSIEPQKIADGCLVNKPADPVKGDLTFLGWYKDVTFTTPWDFSKDTVTSDTVLYAKWADPSPTPLPTPSPTEDRCRVTFITNSDESVVLEQHPLLGGYVVKPEDPVRNGYTFIGWYDVDTEAQQITPWDFDRSQVTGDLRLFAKWRQNNDTPVSVNEQAVALVAVKGKLDMTKFFTQEYGKYTVSPAGSATVTKKGLLTAKKAGDIVVTGYTKDGKDWIREDSRTVQFVQAGFTAKTITVYTKEKTVHLSDYLVGLSTLTPDTVVSSKPEVAEVTVDADNNRYLTVKGKGTAKITASYGEGANAAKYTMNVRVAFPTINPTINLQTGATKVLKLKNTKLKPQWISDDPEKVSVDSNGKVTAYTVADSVKITAYLDGDQYECSVQVVKPDIKKAALTVNVGKTVMVGLKNTKLKDIEWVSSDENIAKVDSRGRVTGISPGIATISTRAGGVENFCTVTVK